MFKLYLCIVCDFFKSYSLSWRSFEYKYSGHLFYGILFLAISMPHLSAHGIYKWLQITMSIDNLFVYQTPVFRGNIVTISRFLGFII